jgi:cytochrome bd-type quinol oxidase subunit 2
MSSNNKRLKAMSVITMVAATGIIFLYIWCYGLFEPRTHNMDRQALRNKFR